jgi:tyrosine-protein phosphatase SIW14
VWKIVTCILFLAVCFCAQAEISHFRRITNHIYTGHQPDKADWRELKQMGFKTVLDLRGGHFHKPRERKRVEAAGMQYISMRLSGIWEPKPHQIDSVLSVLEDPARAPVFLHCKRGDDRVGLVIACYRIEHDHWTNKQALDEARHNGMSRFEILMQRYIRHFHPIPPEPAISAR